MAKPRLCVLVSGGGTTLQNFIDRIAAGTFSAEIVGVISSKANVLGVERAEKAGLPLKVMERGKEFSERVWEGVQSFHPDLVIFAGWLHLLPVPKEYEGRVLNIHPSLLPKFGGKGMYGHFVHEAVLKAGELKSGCTVHLVDNTYDTGPILGQVEVPVLKGDTPEALAKRVFEAECDLYPRIIEGVWMNLGVM